MADPRYEDPHFRLRFARLVTHCRRHAGFLEDGALLRDAGRLTGIPGVMVHGRMDISGPPDVAWRLAQVWPDAELVLIGEEGRAYQPGRVRQPSRVRGPAAPRVIGGSGSRRPVGFRLFAVQ